jgi:hypothetical protein
MNTLSSPSTPGAIAHQGRVRYFSRLAVSKEILFDLSDLTANWRMKATTVSGASAIFLATVILMISSPLAATPFLFVNAGSSSAGTHPAGMAIADLNHDGRLDILAANDSVSTVSVMLAQDAMQFALPLTYATAFQGRFFHHPQPLAIADFNGDGELDYAVTSQYGVPFYVSVALGVGDGTFRAQALFETGICPTSVVAVDANHDNQVDLMVSNSEGHSVSVLLGNGDGTFQAQLETASADWPISVISADFNRDGHADIAQVGWGGGMTILLGIGDGSFGTPMAFTAGVNPRAIVTGDFDRDGVLDLAVANGEGGTISVFKGYGNGSFAPPIAYPVSNIGTTGLEPNSIAAADLDGDGSLDLAVADYRLGAIELFRGTPNGIFDAVQTIMVGSSPSTISASDFNNDGSLDLAFLSYGSGKVTMLLNDVVFTGSFE